MNATFVNAGSPSTPTPATRGRPRGTGTGASTPTGAKRGRKPRGALPAAASPAHRPFTQDPQPTTSLPTPVHWSTPITAAALPTLAHLNPHAPAPSARASAVAASILSARDRPSTAAGSAADPSAATAAGIQPLQAQPGGSTTASILSQVQANPSLLSSYPSSITPLLSFTNTAYPKVAPDEDAEIDDELFPAMADDDYSAQLSWQSQSKDNLK
jgi:transcription initiation factor TFIID subunit 11